MPSPGTCHVTAGQPPPSTPPSPCPPPLPSNLPPPHPSQPTMHYLHGVSRHYVFTLSEEPEKATPTAGLQGGVTKSSYLVHAHLGALLVKGTVFVPRQQSPSPRAVRSRDLFGRSDRGVPKGGQFGRQISKCAEDLSTAELGTSERVSVVLVSLLVYQQ